jgi:GNAT superfamily N-acetyltransferase
MRPAWRVAGPDEAAALRDLEREANLLGLAHVFPAAEHAFPDREVLERWTRTLAEPDVVVEVIESETGLLAFTAYDATTLRHLAVHPSHWGAGLGRSGVERAVSAIAAGGADEALLWCLEANHRARDLYRSLGWEETGVRRRAEWPPYPMEGRWRLRLGPI